MKEERYMRNIMCSRCKKNIAVVFISRVDGEKTVNEGICLKCARELGIKPINQIMEQMGITPEDLDNMSNEMLDVIGDPEGETGLEISDDSDDEDTSGKTSTFPFLDNVFRSDDSNAGERPSRGRGRSKEKKEEKSKRKFLDNYCINLNGRAAEGRLDRIVGREQEMARVIQILNRRQKNNPCLIGEPGVGKTAIAEGIAQHIVDGDVPPRLQDKEVMLLDLTALVAGTQFRGQFESRMKGLIDEIKKQGNIILVIDEVHNLVGAGDAEGSMNAANILKPALSRGEIQVIGATTFNEYRKHIEKDAALERRFQPVVVEEPSIEDSVAIIIGIKRYYEQYHGISVPDEVARQTVLLSERYITDRFLPDKAIDLLDEACSGLNLKSGEIVEADKLRRELVLSRERREEISDDTSPEAYEEMARLRSRECQAIERLVQLENNRPKLSIVDISKVIELWTKIPASKVGELEYERISNLEDRLRRHLIGQDEAVAAVGAAIRRNRAAISAKRKPVSFVFAGPTGVGKTELVKQLAEDMFDTPDALIRLDMSEFMEKHSVSRLIGAPPGYVGYDEAGQLTEKIRRKPYSVVLFDEVEKAHPDVLNVLLQILDDGRVTDAHGRRVSFENTIIVLTTNAGSDRTSGTVGFDRTISEQSKDKILKALSDFMRPEFINRIDEIICFNQLSIEDFKRIARIMLSELSDSMREKPIDFGYDETVIDYLANKSYSIKYGARNLRRLIQKEIEDRLASIIIESYQNPVRSIYLTMGKDGTIFFDYSPR